MIESGDGIPPEEEEEEIDVTVPLAKLPRVDAKPALIVIDGPQLGLVCELTRTETRIGRGPHNHFVLDSHQVSKRHAVVHNYGDDVFSIEDLGSTNDTLVRGVRLEPHEPCTLSHGDSIVVGGVPILVRVAGKRGASLDPILLDRAKINEEAGAMIDAFLGGMESGR